MKTFPIGNLLRFLRQLVLKKSNLVRMSLKSQSTEGARRQNLLNRQALLLQAMEPRFTAEPPYAYAMALRTSPRGSPCAYRGFSSGAQAGQRTEPRSCQRAGEWPIRTCGQPRFKLAQPLSRPSHSVLRPRKVPPGSFHLIPLSPMRKVIGKRLQESKSFIPHFYVRQTLMAITCFPAPTT